MSYEDPPPPPPPPPPEGGYPPPPPPPEPEPAAPKPNWFTRHKVITGLGIVAIAGIVAAGVAGGGDDETSTADETTTTAEATETTEAPTTTDPPTTTTTAPPTTTTTVDACATPQVPNVGLIQRDPDAHAGQCFTVFSQVSQFDQATGLCSFRGYWDDTQQTYNFEFEGENAFVSMDEPCPALDTVGVGDTVQFVGLITGGIEYDTQIGGTSIAVGFYVPATMVKVADA
jgi:hypothetical protein